MLTLLTATDLSDHGNEAVRYALELAGALHARLDVVHTYRTQSSAALVMQSLNTVLEEDAQQGLKAFLSTLQERATYLGVGLQPWVRYGDADEVIRDICRQNAIDLLIVGNKGKSALDTLFFGSVSRALIEKIEIPTLLIPVSAKFKGWKKVGYAVHLQEIRQEGHIRYLQGLLSRLGGRVETLHIFDDEQPLTAAETEHRDWLHQQLGEQSAGSRLLYGEEVVAELYRYALENKPDILAVASHRYSFFERLLVPGISRQLAEKSTVPLLLLPFQGIGE